MFFIVSISFLCFSCGNVTSETTASDTVFNQRELEKLVPKNEALAEKYNRSCTTCHSNPDALAPLVSDKAAWDKLIKSKGITSLLSSVENGYKTMPPKGQCLDCSEEEFEQLIYFMAGQEK